MKMVRTWKNVHFKNKEEYKSQTVARKIYRVKMGLKM